MTSPNRQSSPFAAELTVVIPVHGALEETRDCLTALEHNTAFPYELVVVDDASDAHTASELAAILAGIQGATLIVNKVNMGFGASVNLGVAAARTPFVTILNSDAFVESGWAEPLVELLRSDWSIGAVVPKILQDDGALQEAGVIISGDGRTWDVGNGADPRADLYGFRRRVDYGSAVCLTMRTGDFNYLGGFDQAFGVGYYEDVDLSMRLAEAGLDTVYEPRSQVRHLRGASSKPEEALALIDDHRKIFVRRWSSLLKHRPVLESNDRPWHRALAARDINCAATVMLLPGKMGAGRRGWVWAALAHTLAADRSVRVTLVLGTEVLPGRLAQDLAGAGVELVRQAGVPDVAQDRRMHYSTIFASGDLDEASWGALGAWQCQAVVVVVATSGHEPSEQAGRGADRVLSLHGGSEGFAERHGLGLDALSEEDLRSYKKRAPIPPEMLAKWGLPAAQAPPRAT